MDLNDLEISDNRDCTLGRSDGHSVEGRPAHHDLDQQGRHPLPPRLQRRR